MANSSFKPAFPMHIPYLQLNISAKIARNGAVFVEIARLPLQAAPPPYPPNLDAMPPAGA
jgi:hypothetical protein